MVTKSNSSKPVTTLKVTIDAMTNPENLNRLSDEDSPCIGICTTLFDDICQGCGRTIGEVSTWVVMSSEEKKGVWARIEKEGTAVRFTR